MSRPGDADRLEVLQRFLDGMARGDDANQLSADVGDLHVRHDTFPGEVLMELAADALDIAGTARDRPVVYRELLSTHLPEVLFRGEERRRIQYAILTVYAVRGGLEPDLLDEVTYWIDQHWQYALFAAVAIVRACADSSSMTLHTLVADLAARHGIEIDEQSRIATPRTRPGDRS